MTTSETFLREFLLAFATPRVVHTVEEDPDAVWLDVDEAPGRMDGYYKKIYVAPDSRILRDGRAAIFRFRRDHIEYEIRVSDEPTYEDNLDMVADIIRTIEGWIERRILTRSGAYQAFIRDDPEAWWNVLGVNINASPEQIERAYKQAALTAHPDRGGTHAAWLRLQTAYYSALGKSNPHRG